jgi:hypothetical protein
MIIYVNYIMSDVEVFNVTPASFSIYFSKEMFENVLIARFEPKHDTIGYHLMTKINDVSQLDNVAMYTVDNHSDLLLFMITGEADSFIHKQMMMWGMPWGFPFIANVHTEIVDTSGLFGRFMNSDGQAVTFKRDGVTCESPGFITGAILHKLPTDLIACFVLSADGCCGKAFWESTLTQRDAQILWDNQTRSLWSQTITPTSQYREPYFTIT